MNETISILRTRQNELRDQFRQHPRQFDEEAWERLWRDYVAAGLPANAVAVSERIVAYRDIIAAEHTPMTDAPEDAVAWQVKTCLTN